MNLIAAKFDISNIVFSWVSEGELQFRNKRLPTLSQFLK
jgi:hypothetical protein